LMEVRIDGVSFAFSERIKVLKEVSLAVGHGEFLGIMGPNGSGKTTLLRCLTNFLRPQAGSILIDSRPLGSYSSRDLARMFAVVPQISATDFPFTAYDIVMMGRIPHADSRLKGESGADAEAVQKAMERTSTWEFAKRPFNALSGGERQRVIIARAIAQHPKALLLDEPTIYLDISGQIEIMDLLKDLNRKEGLTVVAVLHDVNLAARYCDRIALLSNGRLEALGPPGEVLTPEMIQSVYGVDVMVRKDPYTSAVYVMPRSVTWSPHRHGPRVHLLCGGGTGGPIMKSLTDAGYNLSAGVLNLLDSDFENAKDLHVPVVAEPPFSPIGVEAHANNLRFVDESSVLVVAPFPVGPGNIRNLEAAEHALRTGKNVFVVRPIGGQSIDFAGGRADAIIKDLITSGAIEVSGPEGLVALLSKG